jgi:guanylate kinase
MNIAGQRVEERPGLFIVSGPSGAGKTSVSVPALERLEGIELSVSTTTRAPRPNEREGVDYRFVSRSVFDAMVASGEFAEHAQVHSNLYGTSKAAIEGILGRGNDVLLDVDVQGALQIKSAYPTAVSIFLMPPSVEALAARLTGRASDSRATVAERLVNARREIGRLAEYDFVIVNDDLEHAVNRFVSIIESERVRVNRLGRAGVDRIVRVFDSTS